MKHSHSRILILTLTALALSCLLFHSQGLAHKSAVQDQAKSMDIVRYPSEPWELVDLRIGSNSIKSAIETGVRREPEWTDKVKFNAAADWHKNVSLKLKNVSGKPVFGVMAYLFYKAAGTGQMFRMKFFHDDVPKEGFAPGAEINLMVNARVLGRTMNLIKEKGADPDLAAISLAVDGVIFTGDTQWYRGIMVCRDPASPNTWLAASCKH